jgi:hypothetical protein
MFNRPILWFISELPAGKILGGGDNFVERTLQRILRL